jgi:hypothetical protein
MFFQITATMESRKESHVGTILSIAMESGSAKLLLVGLVHLATPIPRVETDLATTTLINVCDGM